MLTGIAAQGILGTVVLALGKAVGEQHSPGFVGRCSSGVDGADGACSLKEYTGQGELVWAGKPWEPLVD
jgi:hypothetical protein